MERSDGGIYQFTDADLVNLYAYDLPHLHGFLQKRMETRRDFATFLKRVTHVTRKHIEYNSKTDFEIGLRLGVEKLALTKPEDTFPGIERWVTNSVTTSPVFGFVFIDLIMVIVLP